VPVLMVTHDRAQAARLCQRVYRMEDGRLQAMTAAEA